MSTANAELRRPTGIGCSDLLDHMVLISQIFVFLTPSSCNKQCDPGHPAKYDGRNSQSPKLRDVSLPIKLGSRLDCRMIMPSLPGSCFSHAQGTACHDEKISTYKLYHQQNDKLFHDVRSGLTSRAQAQPPSGTLKGMMTNKFHKSTATGRGSGCCLQRFVSSLPIALCF